MNPLQAARFRDRLGVSGAKSDATDAHMLADMVRTHAHELRPVAGDPARVEAIKVVARTHKTMIWERTRHTHHHELTLRFVRHRDVLRTSGFGQGIAPALVTLHPSHSVRQPPTGSRR